MNGNNENNGNLQTIHHHNLFFEDQPVRLVEDDQGNLWFVAKDMCDILELGNITEALRGLDDDELTSELLKSGGQLREMRLVSEPGAYRLVARSNKPQARRFQRWLYHEVLPSISRTGGYALPGQVSQLEEMAGRLVAVIVPEVLTQVNKMADRLAARVERLESGTVMHGVLPAPFQDAPLYQFETSHVVNFINDRCRLDIESMCPKKALYFQYAGWCGENGEVPYDYNNFFKALYQTGYPLRKSERRSRRDKTSVYVVRGIEVRS